jgi:hypothetical protein
VSTELNTNMTERVVESLPTPTTIHIVTAAVWAGVIAVLQTICMLGFSISA